MQYLEAQQADCAELNEVIIKLDLLSDESICENTFLAKDKGRIVGLAHIRKIEGYLELTHVGVLPEYRKQGVGGELVNKLVEANSQDIYLNTVVPEFFEKLGFEKTRDFPTRFKKSEKWCEGCIIEKCTAMVKRKAA
ncbi:GNAT family N-acetyltransferase [Candidatus Margulisiibacteriota bacterium]